MTPLDVLLRASIVLAAAWALAALLRARSAALRHWVLAAGLAGAAMAPALTALAPAWHVPARAAAGAAIASSPVVATPTSAAIAAARRPIATTRSAVPPRGAIAMAIAAAWAWLAGAAAGLLALGGGLLRLARIRTRAEPLEEPRWIKIRDEVARAYGLERPAMLLQSDRPLVVTWGIASPTVLVPRGADTWSDARIRIVLAHELAHVARRDWLLQIVAEVVRALHWCNPLVWIVCRRARVEAEQACDDTVLNLGISGSEYASHLLDLARSLHARRTAPVPAQAIVRPSSLERRVAAMLNARLNHAPLSRATRIAATVALALVTVAAAGFSSQSTTVLSGTLTDQLGGVLPDITVTLTDPATKATHEVRSDRTGRYEFVGLPSGEYTLGIVQPGFAPVDQRIALAGATLRQDLSLRLGTVQETIFVVDGPPAPMPDAKRAIVSRRRQDPPPPCTADCVGGNIGVPLKTKDVKPIYPESLRGIGGVVTLQAVIDTTGHVSNVQVVGDANPDLAQAAIAAVTQWEFQPTRLDGQIVDTDMKVSVTFKPTR